MRGRGPLVFALGVAILVHTCASTEPKVAESEAPGRSLSEMVRQLQLRATSATEFRRRLPHLITQMASAAGYEEASQELSLEELDAIFLPRRQRKRLATSSGQALPEYQGVQGRPGVDFPVLPSIPRTSFSCKQVKSSGYYADPDTDCQVFHICADGRKISFLCPNGTIFRQSHLICDWWWTVDCAASRELYDTSAEQLANDQRLYRARADALAQSRARQQVGRKPGVIRERERSTARPRQLAYSSIGRPSSGQPYTQPPSQAPPGDFSNNYYSSQNYQTARPQQPSTQPPPPSPSQAPPGGTKEDFQLDFSKNYYNSQNYQTARPQQPSTQPPPPSPSQAPPGGTKEDFQLDFSKNYYNSQNYQTARPQQPSTQPPPPSPSQAPPGGTKEDFQLDFSKNYYSSQNYQTARPQQPSTQPPPPSPSQAPPGGTKEDFQLDFSKNYYSSQNYQTARPQQPSTQPPPPSPSQAPPGGTKEDFQLDFSKNYYSSQNYQTARPQQPSTQPPPPSPSQAPPGGTKEDFQLDFSKNYYNSQNYQTARPQQPSTQPPPPSPSQAPPGGTKENFQLDFSKNYYNSQNYQTARPQQPSTQNQLSPFRSAIGIREELQQARGEAPRNEQASFPGSRQPKQLGPNRLSFRKSVLGAQTSQQTTSRPPFSSINIPSQQPSNRPQQQSVSIPSQNDPFLQSSGKPLSNIPHINTSSAKSTLSVQSNQQFINRNNQQRSFSDQTDRSVQSGRNFQFNSPTQLPSIEISSLDSKGGTAEQTAELENFQEPAKIPKLPQSQKQRVGGKSRSYSHYTLFYDSEGERQQPAETGSFVGNRGNQFVSINKQQSLPQFKDVDNFKTEEKIKFLEDVAKISAFNNENKTSVEDFEFQRKKSKQILDVALSRRVTPLEVQVVRNDDASKSVKGIQVPQIQLQPPEELVNFNPSSGNEDIPDERKEQIHILQKSAAAINKPQLNLGDQTTNTKSSMGEVQTDDGKDDGFSEIVVEETTFHSDFSTTKNYSESNLEFQTPPTDEIVGNFQFLEQPSLFEVTNSSVTTDMPADITAGANDSTHGLENRTKDYFSSTENIEKPIISESEDISHSRNNNLTDTSEVITVIREKSTPSVGRMSRRRKLTPSENMRFPENIVLSSPSLESSMQITNRKKIETEIPITILKSGLNQSNSNKTPENNSRTVRLRTRTSSQYKTSTEKSIFSSRSSRYRIPSLRIIEVTIRSSSTPSPFRFTLPISESSQEYRDKESVDTNGSIFSLHSGTSTKNKDGDIISIGSPARQSSRSGRFRAFKTEENLQSDMLIKSNTNINTSNRDSRRKGRPRITSEPSTVIPPLLPTEKLSNDSLSENDADNLGLEETSSPILGSDEVTIKPVTIEDIASTQLPMKNFSLDIFETTTVLTLTADRRKSGTSRIMMGRPRGTKHDKLNTFEIANSEQKSSGGLAIALSQRVVPIRAQLNMFMEKHNFSLSENKPQNNKTLQNSYKDESNESTETLNKDHKKKKDKEVIENFTLDPYISVLFSSNDTEKHSPVLNSPLTFDEDNNSSVNDTLHYNKFGVAEYDGENVRRKVYVNLNRSVSPKPNNYVNATGRFIFIEQNFSQPITLQENTTEYAEKQKRPNVSLISSIPIRSSNGEVMEGRKSIKYSEIQSQRENISRVDSRRRYKPSTTTEKPSRTTKKSVTNDSFAQVTRSLYTKLTRELLPPMEDQTQYNTSLAEELLDIGNSNKDPTIVNNSSATENIIDNVDKFENSREGLDIPPSLGPKALHSLSVYFATNSNNTIENNDTAVVNETSTLKEVTINDETESFVSATLPPLLTQLTKDSYSRLFVGSKKTSTLPHASMPQNSFDTMTISSSTTEKTQNRSRGKSRSQERGDRARKIDTAIRELQEDYGEKLSQLENINEQSEFSTNFSSNDFHESDLIRNKTPDLRALAQVFSRALSAYLDDPEEFRKALSEVRPTEPSSVISGEESYTTTLSNKFEVSTATIITSEFPSATKEKDEVLDFSDVTKHPMIKRPPSKDVNRGKHRASDILNTESSSYSLFNGSRKLNESTVMRNLQMNRNLSRAMKENFASNVTEEILNEKTRMSNELRTKISSNNKVQTTDWLHSTPGPSTIAQEVNNLFDVSDDTTNYTVSSLITNENDTYFMPTAGGVNDGSRPRYGGFQNNLQVTSERPDSKVSRGNRRKSKTAVSTGEIVNPTTFSPLNKYIKKADTLSTDLTPPEDGDAPWSEEVKKEEIIDDVLGVFIPEDLNRLVENDATVPSAIDSENSDKESSQHNTPETENSGGRTSSDTIVSSLDVEKTNLSASASEKDFLATKVDNLQTTYGKESQNASYRIKNNYTDSDTRKVIHEENGNKTNISSDKTRVRKPSRENVTYSKNVTLEHLTSDKINNSEEIPQSDTKPSVIYSDVIETTPDYIILRSGKSKSQKNNRYDRQKSRVSKTNTALEESNIQTPTAFLNKTENNKEDTTLNSKDSVVTYELNISSSTPIPTSGYTSYSNVEITSKSMVRVTPNSNRRQSRKFKSTTISTLSKNDKNNRNLTRDRAEVDVNNESRESAYATGAVSVVTPTTVTEVNTVTQPALRSISNQNVDRGESFKNTSTPPADAGRTGRRIEPATGTRNTATEVRDMMAKFSEVMETPEQAQAMQHLRRILSGSKSLPNQEMGGMPELNVTSATALINVMKTATTNSTVRRLVLLLVNDSLKDNSIQEAQLRFIDAVLRLPDGLQEQAPVRRPVPARRRPPSTVSRGAKSRRGRKHSTTTTTEDPSTQSSTEDVVEQTTASSSESPDEYDSSSDEKYEIDDRAVSLLRSLFNLASRWG